MKKFVAMLLAASMVLALCGCGHEHTWVEATCTEPKTCSECGETEGEALGHSWVEATCTEPKTCSVCGETEGEALGHSWVEATCTEPKTCSVCGETEGEALGHDIVRETVSVDNNTATRVLVSKCRICGEEFETTEEKIESFIDNGVFTFTPEEFVKRLQNAWDEQVDWGEFKFTYSITSDGKKNFDYYNKNDSWLGWGIFLDEDGESMDASSNAPIGRITIFVGPIEGMEDTTLYYLLQEMMGPIVSAVDPSVQDGLVYKDAIAHNLYATGEDKNLNGLHYSCGYEPEIPRFSITIEIA